MRVLYTWLDTIDYLSNTGILKLKDLTEHLIVIDGGYIGLEYAQAFRRLVSEVTVIELIHQNMRRDLTGGDEIVHSIIDLMYASVPYMVMKNAVHIHPTVSELLPTLLGELKPLE